MPPKRSAAGKVFLGGCLGFLVIFVLLAAGGGFYVWRRASYSAPARKPPQMPQRAAGTLTEFPVDNDPNAPAQPTSVVTQNLTPGETAKSSQSAATSQQTLPPGVDRASLPQQATTITSATYRPRPPTSTTNASQTNTSGGLGGGAVSSGKDQIHVHVLDTLPNQPRRVGDGMAASVTQATGGERTGVSIQSPDGDVYAGSRIRSPQATVYVLEKQNANIVILIYTSDPASQQVADRLAQNVGNGEGLNDYPGVKDALWTLPADLPSDMTLQEVNTATREDIERTLGEAGASGGSGEVNEIMSQMRQFIPERLTTVRYSDASRQEWNALQFEYGSGFQAWRTWLLARSLLGLGGAQSTTILDVDALYIDQDGERLLVFQKGPYLVVLGGPATASVDRMVAFGNKFQL